MDWAYKGVLTAVVVAAVLMAAQLFGRRVAGMLAGLPVVTLPALLWLAADRGVQFAAQSAIGSVAACGAAAVFALTYQRLSRRIGPVLSLGGSLTVGGMAALALSLADFGSIGALLATGVLCLGVLRALPDPGRCRPGARPLRGELWLVAGTAGLVSAVLAAGAAQLGPFWSGLLASLPVISACTLVHQQITAEAADLLRFLRGYVVGLVCKAIFGVAFAALVIAWPAPAAAAAALAGGLLVGMAMHARASLLRRLAPRSPGSTPA